MLSSRTRGAVLTLLLFAFLATLFPFAVYAEDAVVTGNEVNVRTGPGLNYSAFTSLKRNTVVTVTDRSNPDWYQVSWSGGVGYISSTFLRIEAEEDRSAVIQQEQPLPSGSSGNIVTPFDGGTTVIPVESPALVPATVPAAAPSPAPASTPTPAPSSYTVTVQLRPSPTPAASAPPASTPTAAPAPAASPAVPDSDVGTVVVGEYTVIPSPAPATPSSGTAASGDASGSGSAAAGQTAAAGPKPNAEVIGNSVRFRNGPGTTYTIISVLDKGVKVRVSGFSGEWALCTLGEATGYIHLNYLAALLPEAASDAPAAQDADGSGDASQAPAQTTGTGADSAPSDGTSGTDPDATTVTLSLGLAPATPAVTPAASVRDGYVNAGSVRMREGPSMTAGIITELGFGSALKITGESDGWYRVICGGFEGFIYGDYVSFGSYEPVTGIAQASGADLGKQIAAYALNFVGYPYTWGGKAPATGFDCSGFVQYVYSQFGYTTSRVANDVTGDGVHVEPSDLQPGDVLCFYSGNGYVGHVGIYIGDNSFVHAANSATGVVITSLSVGYYASRGWEARRII